MPNNYSLFGQCCWSGSSIRCFFDPWAQIRDKFFCGWSRIPDPCFWELCYNVLGWKYPNFVNWLKFVCCTLYLFKNKIILNFVSFMATKYQKGETTNFFPPPLLLSLLDPWSEMESGIWDKHLGSATLLHIWISFPRFMRQSESKIIIKKSNPSSLDLPHDPYVSHPPSIHYPNLIVTLYMSIYPSNFFVISFFFWLRYIGLTYQYYVIYALRIREINVYFIYLFIPCNSGEEWRGCGRRRRGWGGSGPAHHAPGVLRQQQGHQPEQDLRPAQGARQPQRDGPAKVTENRSK